MGIARKFLGCREHEIMKALLPAQGICYCRALEDETDRVATVLVAEKQKLDQSLSYRLEGSGGKKRVNRVTRRGDSPLLHVTA